jgi:hypothetical protein
MRDYHCDQSSFLIIARYGFIDLLKEHFRFSCSETIMFMGCITFSLEDCIKVDIRGLELNVVDWTRLARGREDWWDEHGTKSWDSVRVAEFSGQFDVC